MHLHNLRDLQHCGNEVIRDADNQLAFHQVYVGPQKIKSGDVLYRPGNVAGSYLFYDVLKARHREIKEAEAGKYAWDHDFFSIITRAKVTQRKRINEYRKLLAMVQTDGTEKAYPET